MYLYCAADEDPIQAPDQGVCERGQAVHRSVAVLHALSVRGLELRLAAAVPHLHPVLVPVSAVCSLVLL